MNIRLKTNIREIPLYSPGHSYPGAVKLSSNENPLGPSPEAMKAIKKALTGIHRYPESTVPLQEILAKRWNLDHEGVLVTNGSDEALTFLTAAWLAPGENGISALETFSQYAYAIKLLGGEVRRVPLKQYRYDLQAIRKLVDHKTRFIFICNPNNPTGTYVSHNEIKAFLDDIPSGILVVLDEAYGEFANARNFPHSPSLLREYPQLIVTRTFSKIFGLAGLRIGYALGDPEIIRNTRRAMMPFSVNVLALAAAKAALEDQDHLRKTLTLVQEGKAYLDRALKKRKITVLPSQGNFLCLHLKQNVDNLEDSIIKGGVVVRNLRSFGLPEHIRYTLGRPEDNEKLLNILTRLLR